MERRRTDYRRSIVSGHHRLSGCSAGSIAGRGGYALNVSAVPPFGGEPFRTDTHVRPTGSEAYIYEGCSGNDPSHDRGHTAAQNSCPRYCNLGASRHPRWPALPNEQFAKGRRLRTQVPQRRSGFPSGAATGCKRAHGERPGLRLSFPTRSDRAHCSVPHARSVAICMNWEWFRSFLMTPVRRIAAQVETEPDERDLRR